MRLSRTRRWSLLAALCSATVGAVALLAVHWHDEQIARAQFEAGYQIGISEAVWDLAQGTAHRYVMGDRPPHQDVDPSSGLPNKAIAGCEVSEAILGRAAGYNTTVAEWRARRAAAAGAGVPGAR